MNDFVTLLARIEFDGGFASWLESELDVEGYEPADGGDGDVIRQAIDDGALEDELPGTVAELLEYITAPDSGWLVAQTEQSLDVRVDGLASDAEPPVDAIRAAIATQLFSHAIETADARGYLYLLDFPLEDDLPATRKLAGSNGAMVLQDLTDADPQHRMDLVERVRARIVDAGGPWPVDQDRD